MPENLTDRNRCHKCDKTGKRKKDKLSKCARCHAITYCSRECQAEDWSRHKENCVPVMVTEVAEKGRGLVAARDIKMGEEILIDKTVASLEIEFPDRAVTWPLTPTIARSLKEQIEALPEEEVKQFYNLKTADNIVFSERDLKIARRENCLKELKIFRSNKVEDDNKELLLLFFNFAFINHSCSPNAEHCLKPNEDEDQKSVERKYELRAIKDISKGEEITMFYLQCVLRTYMKHTRLRKLKDGFGFDCKCKICRDNVDQDRILDNIFKILCSSNNAPVNRELEEVFVYGTSKKYHFTPDEWRLAAVKVGVALTLSLDLHIGKVRVKMVCCHNAVFAAQMARDPVLRDKAMATWKELVMKTGFERRIEEYKEMEELVAKWSPEFNSKVPPTMDEIGCFDKLNDV